MASQIGQNLRQVQERVERAAQRCGRRAEDIRILAVAKSQTAETVRSAFDGGATMIGENYIQEARDKSAALSDLPIEWHFIGHLQTNKAKYAVRMFDLIHTVDSLKLAVELDDQARKAGKNQSILIQVNLAGESSKSGVAPDSAGKLVEGIVSLKNIRVIGLMALPPYFDDPKRARPFFQQLRELRDHLRAVVPGANLRELSMGMTGDFEVAVEEGATIIRVGTAIFGKRR
jgi:pyridoxal phosphate enzyme (YggS family)